MAVVLAGATGNLGGRIAKALVGAGASVRALVRKGTSPLRTENLSQLGMLVVEVDLGSVDDVAAACVGSQCVVSALLGLREVMVDTQTVLLEGAMKAGVGRFIPSDFAMDFTKLQPETNRNLDLHRAFQERLDRSGVQATSVLNGMFMDLLTGEAPFFLWKIRRVLCWGDPEQKMDFTTIDDTAAFTARVALDEAAPRWLRVAGDQLSARELAEVASTVKGDTFKVLRPGGLGMLRTLIRVARALNPAPHEAFPAWQGMQYMHNMYEGKALMTGLANDRYDGMRWTQVREFLSTH
jgi:nucleoside-diphosphate-sugar epimerase